jgi:hypothetical protein
LRRRYAGVRSLSLLAWFQAVDFELVLNRWLQLIAKISEN